MKKIFPRVRFDGPLRVAQGGIVTFLFGGVGYGLFEVLWRGRTHPSMILTGGACLVIIKLITRALKNRTVIFRCITGTLAVTAVEFVVGCVVNLWLRLAVWDYSEMSYNFLGQVCPLYSALWFFVCTPLVMLFSLPAKKSAKKTDKKLFYF